MQTHEYEALLPIFTRYKQFIKTFKTNSTQYNSHEFPKCDADSLTALCDEAIINGLKYPFDKMNRWLGFIQGVLAAEGIISVDVERDFTRPIFNSLYDKPSPSFDSQKD